MGSTWRVLFDRQNMRTCRLVGRSPPFLSVVYPSCSCPICIVSYRPPPKSSPEPWIEPASEMGAIPADNMFSIS